MSESSPLVITSVTFFTSDGKPSYIQETWYDPDGKFPCEQWFRLTDALAFVEGQPHEDRH